MAIAQMLKSRHAGRFRRGGSKANLVVLLHNSYSIISVGKGRRYFQVVWVDLRASEVKNLRDLRHLPVYNYEEFNYGLEPLHYLHFSEGVDRKTRSLLNLSTTELEIVYQLFKASETVKPYVDKTTMDLLLSKIWASIATKEFTRVKEFASELVERVEQEKRKSWGWNIQHSITLEIRNKGYAESPLGYIFLWGFPKYTLAKYYYLITYKGEVFCNHRINPPDWLKLVMEGRLLLSHSKEVRHLPQAILKKLDRIDPALAITVGLKM